MPRAIALIFTTHLSAVLRSKRALICLLLALGPVIVTLMPPPKVDASEVVWIVGMMFLLQLIAPLMGLIAGSAVLTEEIENRTITYAFTRPIPRSALFLGRYLATLVLLSILLALSSTAIVMLAPLRGRANDLAEGMLWQLLPAALLGGAVYALITAALGIFVRRPMVVGLFYLIAMEGFLANLPGSTQKMTVQYYLRGIFTRLALEDDSLLRRIDVIAGTEFKTPAHSALYLLGLIALAIAVATWGIRRKQFVLSA